MRSIWVIFRKEMGSYFTSPIAYIVLAMYTLIFGLFFALTMNETVHSGAEIFELRHQTVNVNEMVIRPVLQVIGLISVFFLPLLTMRLFSEENRTGTMELLATSPVRDIEIVLGKWLAAWAFYGCLLLASSLNFGFLIKYSNPDWKPVLVTDLGLMLMVGSMLAIGTLLSALTKNQIIAAVITFVAFMVLWMISGFGAFSTSSVATVLSYLSIPSHFSDSFLKGVIETKDVVFYVTAIILALFLTDRYLESLRWRA